MLVLFQNVCIDSLCCNFFLLLLYYCIQVPEMFYMPEAFINVNSIDFGTTQQGGKLGMFVCVITECVRPTAFLSFVFLLLPTYIGVSANLFQIQSYCHHGLRILLILYINIGQLLRASMFLLICMSGLTLYLGKSNFVGCLYYLRNVYKYVIACLSRVSGTNKEVRRL
jgi:hypothetical protein